MSALSAIVLAAGKGTRMKSDRPKVLHELAGRPLVAFPVVRALELGAAPVVSVLGHGAPQVEAALRTLPGADRLLFALQPEQRGTAHAVLCAKGPLHGFDGQILVLYGDVPLLRRETLERLLAAPAGPLAFLTARPDDPRGYGRVVRDADGRVARIVEERDCGAREREVREINAGIYRVEARFLWSALARIGSENAQGEFYLTDLVAIAAREGGACAVSADAAEIAGVNDRFELAQAAARLRRELNRAHCLAGVTIVDPEQTYIDVGVELARDVTIEPGCILAGKTRVGEGARLRAHSVLEDAVVGEGAVVGPFARLRPGTVLGRGVHIGNFVETKNAQLGEGTKANHLAYLGDAQVGAGVNVGAGTITCNYDGAQKHRTVLGDGVFIGSDSQLVAPVTIGKGAYVGAGSTITEDVPDDALALTRAPQTNIEGWAARRRLSQAPKKP
ncbi:MAG: bifunctional UDP-N-acetylglucosamine diphosphorylase/glucosamine-1-phosphate N-acetyltransferase GlmU [Deltaproteobacteria bacterium]